MVQIKHSTSSNNCSTPGKNPIMLVQCWGPLSGRVALCHYRHKFLQDQAWISLQCSDGQAHWVVFHLSAEAFTGGCGHIWACPLTPDPWTFYHSSQFFPLHFWVLSTLRIHWDFLHHLFFFPSIVHDTSTSPVVLAQPISLSALLICSQGKSLER